MVTGGCGFIGSHIVDAYIKMGHSVVIVDNLSTGDISNLNPKAKFYEEDICNRDIEGIFKHEKPEIINHHAAQINVRISVDDPLLDAETNIMGSLNLLNLAKRYKIRKFIFASSGGAVYGEPDRLPITEDFPINPSSPYGISKAAVEKYLSIFAELYGIDSIILRYSNVYGPRQISKSEAGVISIFINQILNNRKCTVFGDGTQTRDYVYVGDIVEANRMALKCSTNILNIGTGIETSVNGLINILSDVTEKEVVHEHGTPRPGEVHRNVLNVSKASSMLKWVPKTDLRQGIKTTFDFFSRQDAAAKKIS